MSVPITVRTASGWRAAARRAPAATRAWAGDLRWEARLVVVLAAAATAALLRLA